jgi:hypothetical protein
MTKYETARRLSLSPARLFVRDPYLTTRELFRPQGKRTNLTAPEFQILPEPDSVGVWMVDHVKVDVGDVHPPPTGNFRRIRIKRAGVLAAEDMNVFILDQRTHALAVLHNKQRPKIRNKAQFLVQSPLSRVDRRFAWARMAAASIGPQPARMILCIGPALKQQLAGRIPDQNRNRKMPQPLNVRF